MPYIRALVILASLVLPTKSAIANVLTLAPSAQGYEYNIVRVSEPLNSAGTPL